MTIKVDTVTAPSYWACYLINGDSGDMSDSEIRRADRWAESLSPWYVVDVVEDSERFTGYYAGLDHRLCRTFGPASIKGGDVCDYTVHRQTRKYTRKAGR